MQRFQKAVFAVLAVFLAILLYSVSPYAPDDVQTYLCESERCTVQDWLAALSGWAGFVAAIVGAYLVFAQLSEQRSQSAFVLGDGSPSLDVFCYSILRAPAVLRIVNWNRRLLHVRHIRVESDFLIIPAPTMITFFDPNFKAKTTELPIAVEKDGWFTMAVGVEGWLDRQTSPHLGDFSLMFERADGGEDFTKILEGVSPNATMTIHVYGTFDEGPTDVRLKLTTPIIDMLPNTIVRPGRKGNP